MEYGEAEFGQPDHCYAGEAALIIAVNTWPDRFSQETRYLVQQLIAQQAALEDTQHDTAT